MALSLVALVPGFAVISFTQYQVDRSRHAEVQELAVRSARQAAFEVDRIIAGIQVLLLAVSEVPGVRDMNDAACGAYFAHLRPQVPYLTGLAAIDVDGNFRCGFPEPPSAPVNFAERPYFRDALRAPGAVIGEYSGGLIAGRPFLPVAVAVRDATGRAQAVMVAAVDLAWLGETLQKRGVPSGGSLTVADRNGVIIAREPFSALFVGTRIPDPYLRLLTAPRPGWEDVTSQDGTRRVLGYVPLSEPPVGLYVSAGLSAESSYEAVNVAARIGALLALMGALATLTVTWMMGERVFVRPIRDVTIILRRWRSGDRLARTHHVATAGEIGELGAELDRLMDEIGRSEEQRALLAAELEHRIKNTLATVQALAVTTMNRQAAGKDLLPDFLARITALARSHEVLTHERWDNADLRALLTAILQPLLGDLVPRVRMDGPDIELPPREALGITMVVHELCTNALKYGALGSSGGRLELDWFVQDTAETRLLAVTWREKDGPVVNRPQDGRMGFGTRMISRALSGFGRTSVEFDPGGLICRMEIDLAMDAGTDPPP
jgi:two-component sensor histidine kinase